MTGNFETAQNTLDWAKEALNELRETFSAFLAQPGVGEFVAEFDPQTQVNEFKFRLLKTLPPLISRRGNEALLNIRHSFDQATYAACVRIAGRRRKDVHFPWANCPRDLEIRMEGKNVPQGIREVFRRQEPYPTSDSYSGGNDLVRSLARVANDKHTVGFNLSARTTFTSGPAFVGGILRQMTVGGFPWDPVKNEKVIAKWVGQAKIKGQCSAGLIILLEAKRLPKPVEAVWGLTQFAAAAEKFMEDMRARIAELGR